MATTYDLTVDNDDSNTAALVSDGDNLQVFAAYFEVDTGAPGATTTVTADVWNIWDIPAGTRILSVVAQAPDLADGNWQVGDSTDPDRYLDVADATATPVLIDATEGLGVLYTATEVLAVTFGTLTSVADGIAIKVTVLYTRDFG